MPKQLPILRPQQQQHSQPEQTQLAKQQPPKQQEREEGEIVDPNARFGTNVFLECATPDQNYLRLYTGVCTRSGRDGRKWANVTVYRGFKLSATGGFAENPQGCFSVNVHDARLLLGSLQTAIDRAKEEQARFGTHRLGRKDLYCLFTL